MTKDIIQDATGKMKSTIAVLEDDLQGIRSGRASTGLVERIMVDYYGQEMELRQLANISTPEAMQILIRPFDPGATKAIEKAIQQSEVGVNPNVDGQNIRLNMPPLTGDRRKELVKVLHSRIEEARVAIRNIRRTANHDIGSREKAKEISEDQRKDAEDTVQKLTDEYIGKIDALSKAKEKEILEV